MFIVTNRSNVVFVLLTFLFTVMTFGVINNSSVETAGVPSANKVVVIDAGHGYPDGGAVGINGSIEKDINLAIAKKVQSLLEESGCIVVMTRADDNAVVENLDEKIRNIKRADLKNRRDMRDNSSADAFVSIHMNKFPDSSLTGAQVFYAGKTDESKRLGECIQSELITIADPKNKRVSKKADNSIFILKDATVPSVIVECGFLSNAKEEALLNDSTYQEKIAWGIYSGVQKYFNESAS